jgi:hypothetical protein
MDDEVAELSRPRTLAELQAEIPGLAAAAADLVRAGSGGVAYALIHCDLGLQFVAAASKRGCTARHVADEAGGQRIYEVRLRGTEPIAAEVRIAIAGAEPGDPGLRHVEVWSKLLRLRRQYRERDIKLAKLRDDYDAIFGEGASRAILYAKGPDGRYVRVETIPTPSPSIEAARAQLAAGHYNPKGILEPVDWQWVRDVIEARALDVTGIAEALALADGRPWPPRDPESARRAAEELVARASGRRSKRATP